MSIGNITEQLTLGAAESESGPEELRAQKLPELEAEYLEDLNGIPTHSIDISHSIPELAYGTHSFYRYYGKYPSVLGGFLIDRHGADGPVFDNYLGSGTTLVEAKLRGIPSSGIDVNPLAVLASRVKTREYSPGELRDAAEMVLEDSTEVGTEELSEAVPQDWKRIDKWFTAESQTALAKLKAAILKRPRSEVRDFLTICFLAIIRRCSNAHDGEVRPHVNKDKAPRVPEEAFADKAKEMIEGECEFLRLCSPGGEAVSFVGNAEELDEAYLPHGPPELTISHPPYLNCFDYLPVFNLENKWAQGMPEAWSGVDESWARANQHRAWPATRDEILQGYFENLERTYSELRQHVDVGSKLAIVIGDSTLRGKLIPVHRKLRDALPGCGFEPIEILYRSTHYGIGKYAYPDRADYHGQAKKKDGVIVAEAV